MTSTSSARQSSSPSCGRVAGGAVPRGMMVGGLAFGCAPSLVDAARTLDTRRRDLLPTLLARPRRGPSRRDVVRDAANINQAHAAAAGWHGSTHLARVNPAADRPHRDIAAPNCDRHRNEFEWRLLNSSRWLPTAHQTAPLAVVAGDDSGSAAQALPAHIVHQTRQHAVKGVQTLLQKP